MLYPVRSLHFAGKKKSQNTTNKKQFQGHNYFHYDILSLHFEDNFLKKKQTNKQTNKHFYHLKGTFKLHPLISQFFFVPINNFLNQHWLYSLMSTLVTLQLLQHPRFGIWVLFLILPWPWNHTSSMSSALQHFKHKTSAGCANTLVLIPLNKLFIRL